MADATKAYVEAMSLSVKFFISKNERIDKELQESRQRKKQSTRCSRVEMKKAIFVEVLALETITWRLYDKFVTMHKEVVRLHGH